MNFDIPEEMQAYLEELDQFIEKEIKPLENSDDNIRFFDHRREDARTDWERGGLPNDEWEDLLHQTKRMADAAGFYRYPFPAGPQPGYPPASPSLGPRPEADCDRGTSCH